LPHISNFFGRNIFNVARGCISNIAWSEI